VPLVKHIETLLTKTNMIMKSMILYLIITLVVSMGVFAVLLFTLIDIIGESVIIIAAMSAVISIVITDSLIKKSI
jgi:hypothetical protein